MYKHDCVDEARLLTKYKNLAFWDPDDKCTRIAEQKNLEWTKKWHGERGSKSAWSIIGFSPEPKDEEAHYVPYPISDFIISLIAKTNQAPGVKVKAAPEDEEVAVMGELAENEAEV